MYYSRECKTNIQNVPPEIMERHRDVTLAIDTMFINKILFMITMPCNIYFGTAELV